MTEILRSLMMEMRRTKTRGAQIKAGLSGETLGIVDVIATIRK